MADIKKIELDGTSYDIVGKGMPAGGAAGKVLKKVSGNDYDTEWADESLDENPLPSGGTAGQVLAKNSGTDYDVKWVSHNNLPAGGTAGFALVKNSGTNYDTKWARTSLLIHVSDA